MTNLSKRRKAAKGTVRIKNSRGWLQLVFTFNGRRRYLSLGLTDTKTARALAEMKAKQIELDILSGNFDETLAKYQPRAAVSDDEAESVAEKKPVGPDLNELWEKFVEYKHPQCSPNTMYYVYGTYSKYLGQLPTYDLERASEIRDFALEIQIDEVSMLEALNDVLVSQQAKDVIQQEYADCEAKEGQAQIDCFIEAGKRTEPIRQGVIKSDSQG